MQIIPIITGPTAGGKTSVGIQVALKLGGEIISIDSRQIYRYMDIGTAKPSKEEQEQVRHHFIDIKNPDERYSAGRYGREVRQLIDQLCNEGIVPVLVGGSGLYFQAVVDGFFEGEAECAQIRIHLKMRLESEGLETLYEELGCLDPMAQTRLSPRDTQRILRALEIAHTGGPALADRRRQRSGQPFAGQPLAFCLNMPRQRLYQRIDQRVDEMMLQGLTEEVENLVSKGYGRASYAMDSFGYQEILDYLEGVCSLEQATDAIKRSSRQYAKRQLTWFRRDRRLRWLDQEVWGFQGVYERIVEQYQARSA